MKMKQMICNILIAVVLSVWCTTAYILGEGPEDPNFMRCWQQGNLMSVCPPGFTWSWNMSQTETWHEGEEYVIELTLAFTDAFRNKVVVKDSDSPLINHLNVHSCLFDLGKVCIPFLGSDLNGVTHTGVLTGDDHGIFHSSVSLTEGMWNVIGHGRLYLHDDTFYPLEGSSACNGSTADVPDPWKLDFAIGLPHKVEPPLLDDDSSTTTIAGWQIIVVMVCVVGAVGIVYKFYKHYSSQEREMVRQTAEEALKKALLFEVLSTIISFGLATMDWVTDVMAMVNVFTVDDLSKILVVAYFGMLIIISCLYFYVVYSTVLGFLAVLNEFKNGLSDIVMAGVMGDEKAAPLNENQGAKTGKISYEFVRVRRSITHEKVGLLMGFVEDFPMFAFNAYLIFGKGLDETIMMVSFIINALILGYKFSGIERLWHLTQLKTKIDSMVRAVRVSRQISGRGDCSGETLSRLAVIERSLIDDEIEESSDGSQGKRKKVLSHLIGV